MPTFDAGSIEGKATLDRAEFIAGLDELSAKADEFSRKKITPLVEIQNIGKVRGQLDQINNRMQKLSKQKAAPAVNLKLGSSMANIDRLSAKLDELSKRNIRPDVDLGGVTATSAQLTALRAQLDRLNKQKTTVKVDTKQSEQGLKRLLDAILALAPALAPLGAATVGGVAGLAAAFTAAGVGAGAFALAAVPAIKKVAAAESALDTVVGSRTAAQQKALSGLSKSELAAAKQLQSLVRTYGDFSTALEPTTFTVLAKGADLAKTGLRDIEPVAKNTGQALAGLEDKAKTALDSKFYKTFFNYLAVEAPRSVDTLGRSVGNVGTGFAGLLQTFTPVEHQLEGGLLRLSQRFAAFGKSSASNAGVEEFITYIQREGPVALHLLGQFATTFADVAKDAAPLGAAELKIVSGLLQFIDAEAKAHPKLIELTLGIYSVNKAVGALKLTGLLGSIDKLAGLGGKGLAGVAGTLENIGTKGGEAAAGAGALSKAGDAIGKKFPGVTKLVQGAGGAAGALGETLGATGLAATGVGLAAVAAAGGIAYLGYKLATAKSDAELYYDSLQNQYKAQGNNLKGYQQAAAAADKAGKSALILSNIYGQELQLSTQGGGQASADLAKRLADTKIKLDDATSASKKFHAQLDVLNTGVNTEKKAFSTLPKQYQLSTTAALKLADANGIKLSAGFKGNSTEAKKNRDILQELAAETKQQAQAVSLSHSPTKQFTTDIKNAGDATQTAADQQTNFNNAISLYQDLTTSMVTSAAQVGEAISGLSGIFTKNTSATQRNGAAALILSGNYKAILNAGPQTKKLADQLGSLQGTFSQTYEQMFKTASESGHTSKGFQEVTSAARSNEQALQAQLEKMGLNATEAKKLADKYAGVPKEITTKAHLVGVQQVESDAAGVKKKILDIPPNHTTTTKADIALASRNIATLKTAIKNLPPKARVTAEAEVKAAEGALSDLQNQIYDLTHRNWTVTIDSKGNINTPRSSFGPVQTSQATGGFLNFGGREGVDSIHAMLAPKEYVTNSKIVRREGVPAFDALNAGKATIVPLGRAAGGLIDVKAQTNAEALAGTVAGYTSKLQAAQKYAKSLLADMVNYSAGAGVAQWAPDILKALSILHQPASLLGTVERRMNQESGGNPNAINLWDSNAAAGDPSRGLMQTIMSTFQAYHYPGTSNNIYDPLANILASMQYAIAKYGSLSAAYNRAGGYASGGLVRPEHWFGGGLVGGVFTRPTVIGVGEKGPERVDVTPIPGYASGGAVKKIPGTTFTSPKLFEQAGSRLLDVILGSLTGTRARTSIQQVDNSILHSIDADFTGSAQSGLVKYTQRVNQQMLGLATARDRIANKISAANAVSAQVVSGAKTFADITSLTALGARNITKQFQSKLASINNFSHNIATLKKRGLSTELLTEMINAGIDQGAPMAEYLVKATAGQIHTLNVTQHAIDRAANKLGVVSVNAQFGQSAANNFVAQLKTQEHSLENQMAQLARVFAHGVGHAFHLKGYAGGGHPSAGELAVVGERGPELVQFGANATVHPGMQVAAGVDTSRVEALLTVLIQAVEAGHVIKVNDKVLGRVVSRRQKIDAVRVPS